MTIEAGTQLPDLTITLTRPDVVRYSGASTDFNPIHYSDRAAQAIGLEGVVVHGMWTMGAALRIITDWVGDPARVINYFVRFTRPINVPDTDEGTVVNVTATVTDVTDGVATVAIEVTNNGEKVLGAAKAQVRVD